MLHKFSATLVAVLAITAEAAHVKHQHFRRQYGPGNDALNSSVTSVAPLPSTLASSVPIPLNSAPSSTRSNSNPPTFILPPQTREYRVPPNPAPIASTALSSSSTEKTVSTAVQFPSKSIPLGTGPRGPPYPTAVNSGSTGQGPSGTAPVGTGATESSKPAKPEIPGKVDNETPEASGNVGNEVSASSGKVGSETPEASVKVKTSAKVTVVTSDSAFVTTIGTGSQTTVLTTTIKRTSTRTLFQTVYAPAPSSSATEKGANGLSSEAPEEPTTTIISTITSTRVVILQALPTGEAPVEGKGSGEETPKGGEVPKGGNNRVILAEESCPSPVTVTVTKAPVTVTVTANPPPAKASSVGEEPKSSPVGELSSSTTAAVVKSSAVEEAASSSAVPSFSSVPFNNGTNAVTSRTQPVYPSSGFLTRTSASFTLRPSASAAYY